MSKRKARQQDRKRARRAFNAAMDNVKRFGHGARTKWKRFLTKESLKSKDQS